MFEAIIHIGDNLVVLKGLTATVGMSIIFLCVFAKRFNKVSRSTSTVSQKYPAS